MLKPWSWKLFWNFQQKLDSLLSQCHSMTLCGRQVCTTTLYIPGVDLIKLFWHKFTYSFCMPDQFIAIRQILLLFIKWTSTQKVWVNLWRNSFMRLTVIFLYFVYLHFMYLPSKVIVSWGIPKVGIGNVRYSKCHSFTTGVKKK